MPHLDPQALEAFAAAIYRGAGTPAEHAGTVARHQVGANLAGHDSHGVINLPVYIERIGRGHIVPDARPAVLRETPAALFVDGRWGFGPVVSAWTMARCIDKARGAGIAAATIRDQSHVGRLADYPRMACDAGLIGLMMCDSGRSPKAVAPYGGRSARLGTNPLCVAFPSDLPGPVFIDMATSAVARGKILVARARRQALPPGWVIDKDGRATTDPEALFQGGALVPLGGTEGHKGYGLSFAVETLAALLPGLGFGVDPRGRHNDGAFMLVVNPEIAQPLADFKRDVEAFVRYLKDTPPAAGFDEVLYPGEKEYRTEQRRREEGIPVEEPTWQELRGLGERFGVPVPDPR